MSGRPAALGVACVIATGVSSLTAQESRWDRQVSARLVAAESTLGGRAYRFTGTAGRGTLNTGESASFAITLPAGGVMVLTGVCDDDCTQLDLSLSQNSYETDAARGSGNAPIVRVTPPQSATYRVTVRMAECRVNPCSFAVGVFRQTQTDRR